MTRSILNLAAGLFAAMLPFAVSTPAAQAQSPIRLAVVNVPFDFQAGSSHLTAGTYTITLRGEHFIDVRGVSGSSISMARWNDELKPSASTKVVFHHYGNQYFLREVWNSTEPRHLESPETKAEATMRKAPKNLTIAGAATSPVEITVIAASR